MIPMRAGVVIVILLFDGALAWTCPAVLSRRKSPAVSIGMMLSTRSGESCDLLSREQLKLLDEQKYLVIEDFLSHRLQSALREDIKGLRSKKKFKVAKIGQDASNTLNVSIRVAETCFLGKSKLADVPSKAREELYTILDGLRTSLGGSLDPSLTELLYAYYPSGGFYRRHRDAIPGSASILRKYSLLLYLNDNGWDCNRDGGALRLHLDSGGDELPLGEEPNSIDITPSGGTLVVFPSDSLPHEVLDTSKERMAVVGWYNRPLEASDAFELSGESLSPVRLALLAVAGGLVTRRFRNKENSEEKAYRERSVSAHVHRMDGTKEK